MSGKSENESHPFKQGAKLGTILSVFWIVSKVARRVVRPFFHYSQIDKWLMTEPHYIQNHSKSLQWYGYFEFDIYLTENDEPDIRIENIAFQAPIRIYGEKNFDSRVLANLEDRHPQEFRNFQTQIEAVLTNTPGIFSYQDQEGLNVPLEKCDRITIEYRIYPDGLTQHELMNGIVSIANAIKYINGREQSYRNFLSDIQ